MCCYFNNKRFYQFKMATHITKSIVILVQQTITLWRFSKNQYKTIT
jgi:hypothetical protein